jgi:hypothetical protein
MINKGKMRKKGFSTVYFADIAIESLEPEKTLPAKFRRMLKKINLANRVKDKKVGIKMHFGSNLGYTTIHPIFVRILVETLKETGSKSVKVIDENSENGIPRGYTREVLGCPVVSCFGDSGKYHYREEIGFKKLDYALFSGEALDSDFFIDLAHIKGHGDCGFGGAIKNIAMGIVPPPSRMKLHRLEGGIKYNKKLCTFCLKCFKACPNDAIKVEKKEKRVWIFFHNCTYCQHCVLVCPTGALKMENRKFEDFSRGMALVTSKFLKKFKPENLLFINFLMDITVYCDCWGMSTASLVPDIGILVSDDIAAIETASLDMIKTENLLSNGLPKNRKLIESGKHLFEKIHNKDPYLMIKYLEELYDCSMKYKIVEVK